MVNNGFEKALVQKNVNRNQKITQTGINLLETKPHVIEVFLRNFRPTEPHFCFIVWRNSTTVDYKIINSN